MFSSAFKSLSSSITTNYTLSVNPSATAGAWKVFDGKHKKSGKNVSIFVFDRKNLEPPGGGGSLRGRNDAAARRKVHDEVVERLKKEAASLARLRHPSILELAEPVEDTRNGGLIFATEPITSNLAGLLDIEDEREMGTSGEGQYGQRNAMQKEAQVDELEIQRGLLQVAQGLEFLHESAGLVHGNLTPESIYINSKSDWKISGMAFSGPPDISHSGANPGHPPIALSELLHYDPRLPRAVQLNLDYTSPDFAMDSSISTGADMFSLGLLILTLYNTPRESPLRTSGSLSTYKKLFGSSSTTPTMSNNYLCQKTLPKELLREVLPRLIARRSGQRLSAREFQRSAFFNNVPVSSIKFLESFPAKTPNEKTQFLRGLPRFLDQFPRAVLDKKVLPVLLEEAKDKELLALILGDVFKIVSLSSSRQRLFTDQILPKLREVFPSPGRGKAFQIECDSAKEAGLAMVLESMPVIVENCTGKSFKDDVLPLVEMGLESPTHALVDKALNSLSRILPILDFSTVKNELFPVIATVFGKTSSMTIKVRGLQALALLCGGNFDQNSVSETKTTSSSVLDKYTVQEKVVPLLKAIKTKEPAVMMASLGVLKQIGNVVDPDFLAMDVLPLLWSFGLGPLLNLSQFQEYASIIRDFSTRIEQEHTKKLSDLASTASNDFESPPQVADLMSTDNANILFSMPASSSSDFERLVLGKGPAAGSSQSNVFLANPFAAHPGSPASVLPSQAWSLNAVSMATAQSSRAITPDSTMFSIAPTPPQSSQQALQPALKPAASSNPWASPIKSGNAFAGTNGSNPWASPPLDAASTSHAMGASSRPTASQLSGSTPIVSIDASTILKNPPLASTRTGGYANGFVLAPPPGVPPFNQHANANHSQPKRVSPEAQESLI